MEHDKIDLSSIKTLDDLIKAGIGYCCEYDGKYYIGVKDEIYDTLAWVVDKKTRIAKEEYFTVMYEIPNGKGTVITDYSVLEQ